MEEKLLNKKEAAEFLGMSVFSISKWILGDNPKLPHIKFERSVRFKKSDLEEFIKRHEVK